MMVVLSLTLAGIACPVQATQALAENGCHNGFETGHRELPGKQVSHGLCALGCVADLGGPVVLEAPLHLKPNYRLETDNDSCGVLPEVATPPPRR
jgi:hypothetical protein